MSATTLVRPTSALLGAALALLTACGGGSDSGGVTNPPGATTGSLTVTVTAAAGLAPSVQVTGPAGFARTITATTTLSGLATGTYTVTGADLADVSLRHVPATRSVTATVSAGGSASATMTYALPVNARSTTDRPDEASGSQVKMLYVLPSDGVDAGRDTSGLIQRTTSSWQRWLSTQTSGRHLRLDTFNGGLDVQFVRLPRTDATYRSYGGQILDSIQKDLGALGISSSSTKLYLAYYEGGHIDRCASAAWPPTFPGRVGAIYLHGTIPGGRNCDQNAFVTSPTAAPGYLEFLAPHELVHLMGGVGSGAPEFGLAGHTIVDPTDLMYAGSLVWRPAGFDVARRNYYNPAGLPAGVVNLSTSPYFTAAP